MSWQLATTCSLNRLIKYSAKQLITDKKYFLFTPAVALSYNSPGLFFD